MFALYCVVFIRCVQFPLTAFAVIGTQADRADRNKISLLKLSDMNRTHAEGKT